MNNPVPPSAPSARYAFFPGWQMVGVSFSFMMMVVGFAIYGLPLFYPDWVKEFGWSRADIQFGNTLAKLIAGPVLGFFVGWLIDRKGPRGIMLAGVVAASLALLGFSFASALSMFYLFFFLNALGYLCAGPLPNQVLLSHWFRRMRGRVMGIAYVGIGVGGMLVPWVVHYLNGAYGWRGSMRVLAAAFALVMLTLLVLVRRRPEDLALHPDGDPEPPPAPPAGALRLGLVAGTPEFWLLAAGSVLSIGAIGGVMQNLPLHLKDVIPEADFNLTKTRVMSLTLFSSIAGRITMGWLADRFPKKRVMLLTYLLVALAIPLLVLVRAQPALAYVFAVIFGFGLGADYMLIPLMTAECFGLAALSRILGLIVMTDAVGEATVPYFVAFIRDHTGSYATGFLLLSALALLGAAAISMLRPARARNRIAAARSADAAGSGRPPTEETPWQP